MARKKPTPVVEAFAPLVVYDAMGMVRIMMLALERDDEAESIKIVQRSFAGPFLSVLEIAVGQLGPLGSNTRYVISNQDPVKLAEQFVKAAKQHGATPEAVRLMRAMVPIDEEEEREMAAAAKKLAPKVGDADTLKTAAKAAPAKKAPPPKAVAAPKAAPADDRLAKGRAVLAEKGAAMRARKIKAVLKPKDITAREGTFRHQMLLDLLSSKTVGEFYEKTPADSKSKYDAGCVRYAEGAGFIELI